MQEPFLPRPQVRDRHGEPDFISPDDLWRRRQQQYPNLPQPPPPPPPHSVWLTEEPVPATAGDSSGYTKPSLEEAKHYASKHHPRDPQTGQELPLCSTTTGRHCPQLGRLCDPCGEGSSSELDMYGAGVSSYFKFIKAAFNRVGFMRDLK